MEEHRGHDTVTAAAERTERQRELEGSRHNIQQRIQDRQKELKLLQQEVEDISRSADKTVEDSQEIFTQLISVMEQRRRDVEQQVRSQQEAEMDPVQTRLDAGSSQSQLWIWMKKDLLSADVMSLSTSFMRLRENICSRHNEVKKIFCRSDQQIICYLCSMEEHRGHDTVTAAAERTERQRELEGSRHNIQQRIQDRQKELKLLQQEVEDISRSADKTVEHSQEIFTQLISVMEQRRRDVEQQVRSQQEAEVSRVKELEEKLEQEIRELKRKDAELKKLEEPSRRIRENICSRHKEVKKIFCRSDQQIICYLCSMEEHRGHDTVTAAAERTERQRELEGSRHNIQQRIQDRQKELKLLQQEVEDISRSADKTVEDSQEIFTQLISVMEQRRRDVEQQVRSQQEAELIVEACLQRDDRLSIT
ncbi:uncharacterized protein V6R79_007160 [Siganus canaliculatus]